MPRKSSKTAHVLNLLTSGSTHDDTLQDTEQQEEELSVAKLLQKQPSTKKSPPKKKPASRPAKAETASVPPEDTQEAAQREAPARAAAPQQQAAPAAPSPCAPPAPPQPEPAATLPPAPTPPPAPVTEPADIDRYELVNINELAINEKISSVIERMNLCGCQKCRQDVTAFALNLLPSRYLPQSRADNVEIDRYLAEHGHEVTAALVKSCIKVKANPRH